ncbi:MAG TPA: ATP-binding protein [Candidatus Binataceae bacterium]
MRRIRFTGKDEDETSPVIIALVYAVAGLLWVAVSNIVLAVIPIHSVTINRLVFVCVNTIILYIVASYYAERIRQAIKAEHETAILSRGYFESAIEGIIVADYAGRIRQINHRALEMFGYSEEELLGKNVEILIPRRYQEREVGYRNAFFSDPRSRRSDRQVEVSCRRKEGGEFPAEVSLNFVINSAGGLVVSFISDVTERRAMEREARRNETLHALAAVAGGLAHELNNPLAVILSRIELMLADKDLAGNTRDDLEVLQRNVERASRISGNLLSLARQRPGIRHPVDINGAIADAVLLITSDVRDGGVRVDLSLDHNVGRVMGDQTGLEQVLVNLVLNARDAKASVIRIENVPSPDRQGLLRLTVEDDGCGIDAAALERLFQPFFTTKQKGTGLGLWLSRRIIHDHAGTLEVHSTAGKGTSFVIHLPTIENQAPLTHSGEPSERPS